MVRYENHYIFEKSKLEFNFCSENIATIILYCMHSTMEKFLGQDFHFPQPFLKIELSAYFSKTPGLSKKPLMITEKMDINCEEFFKQTQDTVKQKNMIGCISYLLLQLQNAIDFVHGDFHSKNIMLRKEKII